MIVGQSRCGVVATSTNLAPTANDDTLTTPAGTPLTFAASAILGNDTDPESGTLKANKMPKTPPSPSGTSYDPFPARCDVWGSASDPPNGTLMRNSDGTFTYTSDPGFGGPDTFTYKAEDPRGKSDTAVVTVNVNNGPPTANNDFYSVAQAASVAAPGVLGNDTDADGDTALTAGSASDPPEGSVTLNVDGSFSYTPDGGFDGSDSFTYVVSDGEGGNDIGTVTITTSGVNQPPVAVDDSYTAGMDTPLTVATPGVLSNDTDADGNPVTATLPSDPDGGSVTLNTNGSFTYTPDPAFEGFDSFVYTADDGNGGTDSATVNINVPPEPTKVAINNAWATEGNAGTTAANFTITRYGSLATASSVKYATSNGTASTPGDYTAAALTTVNFAVGEASKPVSITVNGDTTAEANETFNVNLSAPVGAAISDTAGVGTIVDDDGVAFLRVDDVWVTETDAGTPTANFTITRSGTTTGSSTVSYATSNGTATAGTDYTSIALTPVTFAAGETTKPVAVTVTGNTLPEAHETFNVALSAAVNATISDTTGVGTIVSDDAPAYLSVNDVAVTEGNAGTTTANFTITRTGNATGSSTVSYITANATAVAPGDYTAIPLTPVTFAVGETTKPVSVTVNGDVLDEVNETFTVNLSAASGATISDAAGTGTIVDDDGAVSAGPTTFYSVSDVTVTEGNAGTTPATFTVTRSGNTAGTGSVNYVTANATATAPSDYTALASTTLNFAAGETSKPVTVNVNRDNGTEVDETFRLNLSAPVNGVLSDNQGTATINNNEFASFSVGDLRFFEGNAGTTMATFNVVRSGNTSGTASVKYATTNGTAVAPGDFTAISPAVTLNFASGETSKPVTVNVVGDTVAEADETFSLTLTVPVAGVLSDTAGTATVLNDEFAQLTIRDRTVSEGNSGTKLVTFTATRSGATAGTASFRWATGGGTATSGSDYVAVPNTTVNFAAGETTKLLSVTVNGDVVVEPSETFNVNLSQPVNLVIADTAGGATLNNDD